MAYVEPFDEDSDVTKELEAREFGAKHSHGANGPISRVLEDIKRAPGPAQKIPK